ncbi:ABC transporter permease [Paucibacter sp. R3-3]|uniref:ABC transporter permease n=1 Tax=Roseateles agri TaxID=3098619 RepID=A0ABU5DLI6_9BURK|nr:ABC transporter permease [Paucibacter sp. R3-3]MDY0747009.1 ABC transporter permease [Paucibacter sp. R3-3]
MQGTTPPTLAIEENQSATGVACVRPLGEWTVLPLGGLFEILAARAAELAHSERHCWDLRGLERLDSAGALLLWQAWGRRRPAQLQWLPEHEFLFEQLSTPTPAGPAPGASQMFGGRSAAAARRGPLREGLSIVTDHLLGATQLLGQLMLDLRTIGRRPGLIAWRDISAQIYRAGAQALGITALVGFLVGITLSYLTSRQLQAFGADIFVINILGLSVWRELGPLLAAILVAGRSGSAMTAQFGAMRVTQELDALSVMGISHTIRLVLPKLVALAVSMPLIVVWTSSMILLGGAVAARATLGLAYVQFLQGLPAVVPVENLWLGLSKSVVFGLLIAFVASHFGLRIKPNSESLGSGVTQAVVSSITLVIVVDAIFAVVFSGVGLG